MKNLKTYLLEHAAAFNIARNAMPQIYDQKKFAMYLELQGIQVSNSKVDVNWLKPVQIDIDQDKVEALSKDLGTSKPVIVSDMFYILDGHHRYFAHLFSDEFDEIEVIHADVGINKLLILANEFLESYD